MCRQQGGEAVSSFSRGNTLLPAKPTTCAERCTHPLSWKPLDVSLHDVHVLRGVLTLSLGSPWMSLSTTYMCISVRKYAVRKRFMSKHLQKLAQKGYLHMTPTHPPPRAQEVLQAKSTTCAESCTHALSWEPFGGSLLSVPVTKCATRTLQKCAMRSSSFAVRTMRWGLCFASSPIELPTAV